MASTVCSVCDGQQTLHIVFSPLRGVCMNGLKISRLFTKKEDSPFDEFTYERRSSVIKNPDGSIVYEMNDIEVPTSWSQVATDILAQKYIRKRGVPQMDDNGNPIVDSSGKPVFGPEKSIKQVVNRLALCWKNWGSRYGYFASADDAQAFYDELVYMLVNQMAAPNSPQWFNTGLAEAYGIRGDAQGHHYVDPITGELKLSEDAYTHPQPHACFIQSVNDDLVNEGGIFDLVTREARLFKYGSGTGTNFSTIRGRGEKLAGGGSSSGLMSFLLVNDRAAGAIKSGGTTRRAAKMVCLDLDHPEIVEFINWKAREEQKVASLVAGSITCNHYLQKILSLAVQNSDVDSNSSLRTIIQEALHAHVPINYIQRMLQLAKQGITSLDFVEMDTHYESEAYLTVSGQNSNNSVRIPNSFFKAVDEDADWNLVGRLDGSVFKTIRARDLWGQINLSAWMSADPGVQYDTTINEWHTCPKDGRINASNPCSEYMFLDDTACNLASLNILKFFDRKNDTFDVNAFKHAARLWTIVLEISVLMAQFPSKEVAMNSYQYRTLGLGFANIGSMLMSAGVSYDSDKGRSIAAAISAIMGGTAYATSAEMASILGPFPKYSHNKEDMLRVIRNHRRAAYNAKPEMYEGLSVFPVGIDSTICPSYLHKAALEAWDLALERGKESGYRNAQVTVVAPTGTIGLVMDCDTTGIEPDFALVKFKKLAGGGYFKIVNQSVPPALETLGYSSSQINEIIEHAVGHKTLVGAPHINHEVLEKKGFSKDIIKIIESQLATAFDLRTVFSKWTLGEDVMKTIGVEGDVLTGLGFSSAQIKEAEKFVCGAMTIEGAPHLEDEHLPVFDCANKCGDDGKRYLSYMSHIKMLASVQPFISGAISKTINMDASASVDDVANAYRMSWELGVKAVALYRDGSKLSQPLNASNPDESVLLSLAQEDEIDERVGPEEMNAAAQLSARRKGYVQESVVGGQPLTLRTSEFDNGRLAEVVVDVYKEGSAQGALLKAFAKSVSLGLKHGTPLKEYVEEFTFTKFDPQGMVQGDQAVKSCTSIVDYLFRHLAFEYLDRTDLVHNKEAKPKSVPNIDKETSKRDTAKSQGYTGDECSNCGSMHMRRNGTCSVCEDCGTTTGCS